MFPEHLAISSETELVVLVTVIVRYFVGWMDSSSSARGRGASCLCAMTLRRLRSSGWMSAFEYVCEAVLSQTCWKTVASTYEMAYVESFLPSAHVHALIYDVFTAEGCMRIHDYMMTHMPLFYFSNVMTIWIGQTDVCETEPELGEVLSHHIYWSNLPQLGLPSHPQLLSQESTVALAMADQLLAASMEQEQEGDDNDEVLSLSSPRVTDYLNRSLIDALIGDSSFNDEDGSSTQSASETVISEYNVVASGTTNMYSPVSELSAPDMYATSMTSPESAGMVSDSESPVSRPATPTSSPEWQNAQPFFTPSPDPLSSSQVESSTPVCIHTFSSFFSISCLTFSIFSN